MRRLRLFAAVLSCSASLPLLAAETWNLANTAEGTTSSNGCALSAGSGNSVVCSGAPGSVTATLKGYGTPTPSSTTSTFAASYLKSQGGDGLGMTSASESTTSPDHAADSIGNTEMVAVTFSRAVTLESVTFGWTQSDADFSLLAWTGGTAPNPSTAIIGKKASELIGAGWSLVQMVGDTDPANAVAAAADGTDRTLVVNNGANKVTSSYWLIGAFNSTLGGPALDGLGDAWKLLAISGSTNATPNASVPEPGSLALVALAAIGAFGTRRIKKSAR